MIDLRLLGEIRLRAEDGSDFEGLLRQPKRLALLTYIAAPAPGTWHRRDTLLALFWPELDTAHARTSLRNSLYILRQALGADVVRTRGDEEISIDPEKMRTDLARVFDALRSGRIEDALAEYGGELLPGLYPPDSEGFQRWLESERTRLKVSITSSAIARVGELEREGKHADALSVARRIVEIQPDDETVVRRVMSLHETIGDKAGALSVFETYRARLANDFDAEPADETKAIAERLRAAGASPSPRTQSRMRLPESRPSLDLGNAAVDAAGERVPPAPRRRWISLAGVAIGVLAIVAFIAWRGDRRSHPDTIGTSSPLTTDEGLQVQPAISPNGRLVAYAKGNVSRLRIFVHRIGGGAPWPLTGDSASTEMLPRWAPDNDRVLFLSRANAYVAPAIGGAPQLIARGSSGDGMVRSASWSPTGDSIAIVRNDSLIVKPLLGSGSRLVGRGEQLHSCVWSPNGKWIACISGNWIAFEPGPLFGNRAQSAILLFPAAGGDAIDLTGHEFQHESPAWSADGAQLWILSDRGGVAGEVYSVPVSDDGRAGEPTRMGLTAEAVSLSAGRLVYSVPVRRANLWTVPIPGGEQLTLENATRVTSGNQIIELVRGSIDGGWLVYDSNVAGNADIYRIPAGGGAAERLTDDPRPEFAGALSPDGSELAWHRWLTGERHLFMKRLDSDSAQEILRVPGDQGVPTWSPDGQAIAAWSHNREAGAIFVMRRNSQGVWMRPEWRLEGGQLPVWSRDGKTLAFVRYDGGIETIPADSGARQTVYSRRPGTSDPIASNLVWSLDASTIWFIGSDEHGKGGIWSVAAGGGSPRLRVSFDDPSGRLHGPAIATDGSRFYFTLDERFSNVRWAELGRR